MRAPMLITAFVVYVFAMPVAIQAGQARTVPEVGVLLPVVRADKNEVMDSLKAAFMDGLQALGYVEGKKAPMPSRPKWARAPSRLLPAGVSSPLVRARNSVKRSRTRSGIGQLRAR